MLGKKSATWPGLAPLAAWQSAMWVLGAAPTSQCALALPIHRRGGTEAHRHIRLHYRQGGRGKQCSLGTAPMAADSLQLPSAAAEPQLCAAPLNCSPFIPGCPGAGTAACHCGQDLHWLLSAGRAAGRRRRDQGGALWRLCYIWQAGSACLPSPNQSNSLLSFWEAVTSAPPLPAICCLSASLHRLPFLPRRSPRYLGSGALARRSCATRCASPRRSAETTEVGREQWGSGAMQC